jgi:hypothetical protein
MERGASSFSLTRLLTDFICDTSAVICFCCFATTDLSSALLDIISNPLRHAQALARAHCACAGLTADHF